jgi:DNA (cytosine-5)-methyltransferase 1
VREGFDCKWQVEIDSNCLQVLDYHFRDKEMMYEDVREVGKRQLGSVDVISGGFPCQDVSVAGNRAGLSGRRSGLWFEFARIIEEIRPSWVVIENVPGLLSSQGGRDFATILYGLAQLRYGVSYRVLDSRHFGVAQRRRRVFVVGSLGNGRSAEVLFESEGMFGGASTSKGAQQKATREARKDTVASLQARDHKGVGKQYVEEGKVIAQTITNRIGKGAFTDHVNDNIIWHNKQSAGEVRVQKDTSPTISKTWGTGGNNTLMVGARRLMPVECERLQGFPDGWTAVRNMSDSARYRMLGNAVTVNVAEWIAGRIRKVLNDERQESLQDSERVF